MHASEAPAMLPRPAGGDGFGPPDLGAILETLDRPHLPSPNSAELIWSPLADFAGRAVRPDPHIAELFHVNSKLIRRRATSLCSPETVDAVREWFLAQAASGVDDATHAPREVAVPHHAVASHLRHLLAPFAAEGNAARLLFAVDLAIVTDGGLFRQVPARTTLWREHPPNEATAAMRREPPVHGRTNGSAAAERDYVVVTAVPWRYMALLGPHGYRRALLDAGRVVEILAGSPHPDSGTPMIFLDPYQQEMDEMLGIDGIERSAVALVEVSQS